MNKIDGPYSADDKLEYILDIFRSDAPPDIFVVVEVFARTGEFVKVEGTVLEPTLPSAKACLKLLQEIRNLPDSDEWCLVPPLALGGVGFTEGVAVSTTPVVCNLRDRGSTTNGLKIRTIKQARDNLCIRARTRES